ncbi:DUF84 family protein [Priestia megaterium]|nr:DUF84 family protein [Priestia megaterium]
MKVAIGTVNPVKVNAVKSVFGEDASYVSMEVESGVAAQPFSDEETIQGAINRAMAALQQNAQIGIGLEGGVVETTHGLFLCNWGALVTRQRDQPIIAGGARVLLPDEIAKMLRVEKIELAEAMERFTKQLDVRKKEGAIGVFTNGMINRTAMFEHVVRMLYGQYLFHQKLIH